MSAHAGSGFDDVLIAYLLGIATAAVVALAAIVATGWSP